MPSERFRIAQVTLIALACLLLPGTAAAAPGVDIRGSWDCSSTSGPGCRYEVIELNGQTGRFSGRGSSSFGTFSFTGTLDGLAFTARSGSYAQRPGYGVDYRGRVSADNTHMAGTFTDTDGASGPFDYTRISVPSPPAPVLFKTATVERVGRGPVFFSPPPGQTAGARASQKGRQFFPIEQAREIPTGSLLDTRKGRVKLSTAKNSRGAIQSGQFFSGLFQVLQSRRAKGLTELRLKGASFSPCARSGRVEASARRRLSRRTIRRLRGSARGRFRTRGRYSAATVRGTNWTVSDRCDGTLTKVTRGRVTVRDFRRKRTVVVRAGKSYLARAR